MLPLSTVIHKFKCPDGLDDSDLESNQQIDEEVWQRENLQPPIKCFLREEEGVQGCGVLARDAQGMHKKYTYDREAALFIRRNSLFPPLQIQCWHPQSSAWKFWDGDADGLPKLLPDEKVPLRAVDRFGKWRIFAWAPLSGATDSARTLSEHQSELASGPMERLLRGLRTGLEMGDSAPVIDDSHPPVDMEEIYFKATSDSVSAPRGARGEAFFFQEG